MVYMRAIERAGGLPVVLPPLATTRSRRCSTGSTASASPAAPTSTPPATARTRAPAARPDRARPRRASSSRSPARRRARHADPRHLPRHAGAQRRPRRHAAPAPPRLRRRDRPPPAEAGRITDPRGADRARLAARARDGRDRGRRQLVPPPGRRPPRPGAARGRVGARRRRSRGSRRRAARSCLGVQWHAETLVDRPEHARAVPRAGRRGRGLGAPRREVRAA